MHLNGSAGLHVAVAQMNSGADKEANVASALDLIDRVAAAGARPDAMIATDSSIRAG